MLSKLVGVFKQTWLASLIGLIIISIIIYVTGGTIGWQGIYPLAEVLHRYIAIVALFITWGLWQLWKMIRARRRNQQMLNSLMASPEQQRSAEEVATEEEVGELKERLQDALQSMEKARRKNGKSTDGYLYQLPWYIIIGPPGAGKTTLLANSNLHFPLSDKYGRDALRGVQGTRNCDWWFTDDAILLDTAGRYVIHGGQQALNEGAWLGFLSLLKEYRTNQPINGALIAVSLADFLEQSADTRAQHAKAIRQRIQELHEHLGIRFPVYMLFTKADLLAGFTDFFDDLDKEGRGQVWGMTFPFEDNPDHNNLESFSEEFGLLEEQLQHQLVGKLENERSAERRRSLYLFPQQFSSMKNHLYDFLLQIYQSSRFERTALLRGVYFTSATQEGAPIDRIMASLASNFGVAPQQVSRFSAQGKSFFINYLLSKVVFNEAGLAGFNQKVARRKQWVQSAAIVGAVVLLLLGALLWGSSYFQNRVLMEQYQQQVALADKAVSALPANASATAYVDALERVRQLTWSYTDGEVDIPWLARFGLSQIKSLREVMDEKYVDLLKERMTPYVQQLLEQQIKIGINDPSRVESLFNSLKSYLFLGGQAPSDVQVSGVNNIDWNNNAVSGDEADWKLAVHFKTLLEKGSIARFDKSLADAARDALEGAELDKLAYYQFKAESLEKAHPYDFLVRDKDGLNNINGTFRKKSQKPWADNVAGFYTKAGYEKVFLPNYLEAAQRLAKESWVLGSGIKRLGDPSRIAKTFLAEYQNDYIKAWQGFLMDIYPQPVQGVDDAKVILSGMTSNGDNIFYRLLEEVVKATDYLPTKDKDGNQTPIKLPPLDQVDKEFQDVQDWTDPARFQSVGKLIDDVYTSLNQEGVFSTLDKNALIDALGALQGEAMKLPPEIRGILLETVVAVRTQVVGVIKSKLLAEFKNILQEQVGDFCQAKLQGRFPMAAKNKQGMAIGDFASFFQNNGKVDLFSQQQLNSQTVEQAVLTSVERQFVPVNVIRAAFLADGYPNFNYQMTLSGLDSNLWENAELVIGTQSKIFKNGDTQIFRWPDGTNISVKMTHAVVSGGVTSSLVETVLDTSSDKWVLFRTLNKKKLLIPNIGIFTVKAASTPDPFNVIDDELRRFKCPTL